MKSIDVKATVRSNFGKKSSHDLRESGSVPAVLYGAEHDADGKVAVQHLAITNDALRKLVYTPDIFEVNLDVDGTVIKAVMKDIQFHPVSDRILHVDFYKVTEDAPIVMEVPVALNGLAEGVRAGGKLQLLIRKLKVKALYTQIPERLDIDVTSLGLGKTIKVGDLSYEGLEIMNAKEAVVCAVKLTRAARGAASAQ